jgi:hypothetical protein
MVWAGSRALARAGVGRTLPLRPIAVAAAVLAVGIGTGLVWAVVSALRTASSTAGPADILAPASGYDGRMAWSEPAAYLPVAIAALTAAARVSLRGLPLRAWCRLAVALNAPMVAPGTVHQEGHPG